MGLMFVVLCVLGMADASLVVRLDMFSGRPNPVWKLDAQQEAAFFRLAKDGATVLKRPQHFALGYTGFTVFVEGSRDDEAFTILGNAKLELFLLSTMRMKDAAEERDVASLAKREIALLAADKTLAFERVAVAPAKLATTKTNSRRRQSPIRGPNNVTFFTPEKWNFSPRQYNNNCYNYGSDVITDHFSQPGQGSGRMYRNLTCDEVFPAAARDRLIPLYKNGNIVKETPFGEPLIGHFIGLFVWPRGDFHFYRLDASGFWSHKPGSTKATDTDNKGELIPDPATADRGRYSDLCGWFIGIPTVQEIN